MKKHVVILFFPKAFGGASWNWLPYTLLHLERGLRDLGLEIILVDETRQPDYLAVLADKRGRILLAGVSSMTGHQISGGIAFSKKVREICDAPIVWGGWHPTLLPEQTLQEPYIDFVVVGQGERPLRQLVERLLDGQPVTDIRGLGFKQGGVITVNPPGEVQDINAFPRINLSLLNPNQYVFGDEPYVKRSLNYFASHGCPFHCGFCSVAVTYRRHWYHKPVPEIIEDLRFLKEHARIDSVSFDDDNLFINVDFCRELAQAMIDAKLELKWKTGAHAHAFTKNFTDADIRLLAKSGCWRIYIGAESGDQEALDLMDKRAKVEETYRFIEMLKPHGIIPRLSTMVCLPIHPERDFTLTLDMIGSAKLMDPRMQMSVFFYTPYPSTALYDRAKQMGFVPPQCLEHWAQHGVDSYTPPWAPKGAERRLRDFREVYFSTLDHQAYRKCRDPATRVMAYPVNKILYFMAWLRVKAKCYQLPIEVFFVRRLKRSYKRRLANRPLPSSN
jgi:anaerobic magnesium-protoporphyrin IX monomethyl ester cyclase